MTKENTSRTLKTNSATPEKMERAKLYRSFLIGSGVCGYPEHGENVLLAKDDLYTFANSIKGAPFTIDHNFVSPAPPEGDIVGYAAKCDVDNGEIYVDFIIYSAEAARLLEDGYEISLFYKITEKDDISGHYNGVEYAYKVEGIQALHIAIVKKGRYSEVNVFANSAPTANNNDKPDFIENKMNPFKRNNKMTEKYAKIGDKKVTLKELANAYVEDKKIKANQKEEADLLLNEDEEVDVDGEKVKVSTLTNLCKQNMADAETKEEDKNKKKNEDDEDDEEEDEDKDENKKEKKTTDKKEGGDKKKDEKGNGTPDIEAIIDARVKEALKLEKANSTKGQGDFYSSDQTPMKSSQTHVESKPSKAAIEPASLLEAVNLGSKIA